jgi:hypothetical protein
LPVRAALYAAVSHAMLSDRGIPSYYVMTV